MENHKQQLLKILQKHIHYIQEKVLVDLEATKIIANRSILEIAKLKGTDQVVAMQSKAFAMQRVEELEHLHGTPYFVKCEVKESDTQEKKNYYFAKHQLSGESIYSWVAPVAAIRFENPGEVS